MNEIKHYAIYGPQLSAKSSFIQNLLNNKPSRILKYLKGKRGVLFSTITLEAFLKEESIHDDNKLSRHFGRGLETFSSGEQRKALLQHLIESQPDFLILDNVFDMIDTSSVENLQNKLSELSSNISIIQLVKRKDSLLQFITNAIRIENEELVFSGTCEAYQAEFGSKRFTKTNDKLPAPLEQVEAPQTPLISFIDVNVKYGDTRVVNSINWEINKGDFWQLMGPNGSGKTTLLSMITGDNPKAYGQNVKLFGHKRGSGESIWDIKKKIGYVTPAMTSLFRGWNTVEKMVISGLVDSIGLYKKPSALQKDIAKQWIKLIGLKDKIHTRFSTLSEVEQCMVLIARAMIKHPPLLILDEPAHGLDDHNAAILSALINKISSEGQTTIIYVSHRKEPGLQPNKTFELVPSKLGSTGSVVQSN